MLLSLALGLNTGRLFISLKPSNERKATEQQIIELLRPRLAEVPGILPIALGIGAGAELRQRAPDCAGSRATIR